MKVLPFTIPKPEKDALILQDDKQPLFYEHLHRHEEIQISLIIQGTGTMIAGNAVNTYQSGDVFVLGSNLPHVFQSVPSAGSSHMFTIFFTRNSFGAGFFDTEELKTLRSFFKKTENGFKISQPSKKIRPLFDTLRSSGKFERFLIFIQLLKALNTARHQPLSHFNSEKKYTDLEGQRMGAVINYTMLHFRKKITLDTISKEAAMTPNAFCKYFKKRTRKTYVQFLNELRMEEACKLLLEQHDLSIAAIAERSGFRNISNFNRKFKQYRRQTPMAFKKQNNL
ncbi:MAG: AraC family transcriptional regulator [Bacteroidota bacterium]